jgi:ribosome maturation factor RimP
MDLAQAATDVLAPLGYEVLELNVNTKGKTPRVMLRIDRLDAGIVSVEDVALASEAFGLELDRIDPYEGAYHLEVESPGAKRPLKTPAHFERFHDLKAKVRVGDETFTGTIVSVGDQSVVFEVGGSEREVPLRDIDSARLAEWPDTPR